MDVSCRNKNLLEVLVKLSSGYTITDHDVLLKLEALYGDDPSCMSLLLMRKVIFPEDWPIFPQVSQDSRHIYAYANSSSCAVKGGLIDECLSRSFKLISSRAYSNLILYHILEYIRTRGDITSEHPAHQLDYGKLLIFIDELRSFLRTLCSEDRRLLIVSSKSICKKTFSESIQHDACFTVYWAIIEAAKCRSENRSLNAFTDELIDEMFEATNLPMKLGSKVSKLFLINLVQCLEKIAHDRLYCLPRSKLVFQYPKSHRNDLNLAQKLRMLDNVRGIAKLSLAIDDAAGCWRNVNLSLLSDLSKKSSGQGFCKVTWSTDRRPSLGDKGTDLELLAVSAKHLDDLNLLTGIEKVSKYCDNNFKDALLRLMISNTQRSFEKTLTLVDEIKCFEDQYLMEYLNACISLDRLDFSCDLSIKPQGELHQFLSSKFLRDLYSNYFIARNSKSVPEDRIADIEEWLSSWTGLVDPAKEMILPAREYMDLVIPTCLNIVARLPPDKRQDPLKSVERMIEQDLVAQSLFLPSPICKKVQVYQVLLDILGNRADIPLDLVEVHSSDLEWNDLLFRYLCEMNLTIDLHKQSDTVSIIQIKAAKYNIVHGNLERATWIVKNLISQTTSAHFQLLADILDAKIAGNNYEHLLNLAGSMENQKELSTLQRHEIYLKILRILIKSPESHRELELHKIIHQDGREYDPLTLATSMDVSSWQDLLNSSSLMCKAKTLRVFADRLSESLLKEPDNDIILNDCFRTNLQLLEALSQLGLDKFKSSALGCGSRILRSVVKYCTNLSKSNLEHLDSIDFFNSTASVWITLKTNLISIVLRESSLPVAWRVALKNILKGLARIYPNQFVYSTIVNRLDLQNNITSDDKTVENQEPYCLLMSSNTCELEKNHKLNDCQKDLDLWNELFNEIKSSPKSGGQWETILIETETFLREIRKISFLCGEYLKMVTIRITTKLNNFVQGFSKACDNALGTIQEKNRLDEWEKKLKALCNYSLKPIKLLLAYDKKSKYDFWFAETFSKQLQELEYRLNLLSNRKLYLFSDLDRLVKSITELLGVCRKTLLDYNHNNRQKLYMELISPVLSRLEPSLIPMPECCSDLNADHRKNVVTIHKISQTLNLISSKTHPKKIGFIGSDGFQRSFLLKAHEDLRLDELIMNLFGILNDLFLAKMETRYKYQLRCYSVTPVSSRSALIQWVEAPSLYSFYKKWLSDPEGIEAVADLLEKKCKAPSELAIENLGDRHDNYQQLQNIQMRTIFQQLLWSKIDPVRFPMFQSGPLQTTNSKIRSLLDPNIFEEVIQELIDCTPDDLISNKFWFNSINSYSYWLKTRQFINSCAAISMVGYIIGLGDRHPDNILVDENTGEVIHIDLSVCFELGKQLVIPERVPFRLTQNIIYAFGFAGLEGGFTSSCCDVLNAMKDYKSAILDLLDPINLSFMIGQPTKSDDDCKQTNQRVVHQSSIKFENIDNLDLEMRSQESVDINSMPLNDIDDLLILNNRDKLARTTATDSFVKPIATDTNPPAPIASFDLQHEIKTPMKVQTQVTHTMHERIKDKLTGNDECIRNSKYLQNCFARQISSWQSKTTIDSQSLSDQKDDRLIDLITLNDVQSTSDQVTALVAEAISLKNMAAMFEGWAPWV